MRKLIALPDKNLRYVSCQVNEANIIINIKSISKEVGCPYCGTVSKKVHSRYVRKLQDLPIQGKKAKLVLTLKKYFCKNPDYATKTFAETFSLFEPNATKTKRLEEEILKVSLTQSSISAAAYLQGSVADVGKSTICNMLKKTKQEC